MLSRVLATGVVAVSMSLATWSGLFPGAQPARADEVYPRPASGTVQLSGHGYGHGRGMSQWGSYGAAVQGIPWQQIVGHYYPGTTLTDLGRPTVRVDVRGDLGSQMAFPFTSGLYATFGPDHTGSALIGDVGQGGSPLVVLQVVANGSGQLQVMYLTRAGFWYAWGPPTSQVNITNPASGAVTAWGSRGNTATYAGEFRAVLSSGSVVPVAATPMEAYVRGVVPHEAIPSWPGAALAAQAVAARTYAANALLHPRAAGWDICDSTSCQVFAGSGYYASTDAATTATAGVVLTTNGTPISAEFSASSGGWNASGGQPYLPAQADPWDLTSANPHRDWSVGVSAASIESQWPSIGTYRQMRVTARDGGGDWGGRVVSMALDGSAGSVTVSGDTFRGRFGLKSTYFTPVDTARPVSFPRDYTGDGRADLLYVQPGGNNGQLVRRAGNGTGDFGPPETFGVEGWFYPASFFSAGAWDGDGVSDVMTIDTSGNLFLWRGPGFGSGTQIGSGFGAYDMEFPVGDFNGDGRSDFFARSRADGSLWMFSATSGGGVSSPVQVTPSMWDKRALFSPGDFDGDGFVDLLAVEADKTIRLFSGDGHGGWKRFLDIGREWDGTQQWFSVGDATGDGRSDVYFTLSDGTLRRLNGTGTGAFASVSTTSSGWSPQQIFLK